MKLQIACIALLTAVFHCTSTGQSKQKPYMVVLGIAQDAGYPHMGCKDSCCASVWDNPEKRRMATSLALIDPASNGVWLFEASPDMPAQFNNLSKLVPGFEVAELSGIFLTHGHIGHYAGLMYLGREAMGTKGIPVYAMPRMKHYLKSNGPWSLLDSLNNISIKAIDSSAPIRLNERLTVVPFLVPHRDEFTETVGYKIMGPHASLVFIPDIDKWQKWERDIVEVVRETNYALLDGTFYTNGELPGRDMSEIPHPFISESMQLFEPLPAEEKSKIVFIHFNHSNPALQSGSEARKNITGKGYRLAEELMRFEL